MAIAERGFLQQALIASKGNRTEAARLLGISRKNLWEKMRAHALE
jgi:two-component system response regulator AtoC